MQQNITSQVKALQIAIKLEASPIEDTNKGMRQIQSQMVNLTLQIQDIKKRKEVRE